MTAVVGILNKHAIAIAADSAVTFGGSNGNKIFNKANKLFTLSKKHPVGIMIYNAASFMATPWETMIKIYRTQLDDRYFSTLKEYQEDFIEFLRSKDFYTNPELQIAFLEDFVLEIINSVLNDIAKKHKGLIQNSSPDRRAEFLQIFEKQIENLIVYWKQTELCVEFEDYTFEMFSTYSNEIFESILQIRFIENGIEISEDLLLKIKQCVYTILRVKESVSNYTGLIFTGFGEDEIYPQLIPVNISMLVDNKLRYYIDEAKAAQFQMIMRVRFVLLPRQMLLIQYYQE